MAAAETGLLFGLLCGAGRLGYTFNDYLTGLLSREAAPLLIGAQRGIALAFVMAPLLLFVPADAWQKLPGAAWPMAGATVFAAFFNVTGNAAARCLPFGVRAAVTSGVFVLGSMLLDALVLGQKLGPLTWLFAVILAACSAGVCLGTHAETEEFRPDIPKGVLLAVSGSLAGCAAVAFYTQAVRQTHPLLTGWLWEAAIGLLLFPIALAANRESRRKPFAGFWKTALYSSPTAAGTGGTAAALTLGPMSVVYSTVGLQAILTSLIGSHRHGEKIGLVRWACVAGAATAIAGVALTAG